MLAFICLVIFVEVALRIKHGQFLNKNIEKVELSSSSKKIIDIYKDVPYVYKPYVMWGGIPNQTTSAYKTNSLGFRGNEFSKVKTRGTFRIIILGGSTAWGWGSTSNETTISGYLESQLNKKQHLKKVEVLNFANNAYNSSQEIVLWREISDYNPDLVIHYTGNNDITVSYLNIKPGWNFPLILESNTSESIFKTFYKGGVLRFEILKQTFTKFIKGFRLYDSIKYRFDILFKIKKDIPTYSDSNEIASIFERNMLFSTKVSKSMNVPLLIFIQPTLFTEDKKVTKWENYMLGRFENDYPGGKQFYIQTRQQIINKLNENRISFYDTRHLFADIDTDLYYDTAHFNDKGNEVTAEKIANIILNNKIIK